MPHERTLPEAVRTTGHEARSSALTVAATTTLAGLEKLRPEWKALYERSLFATPFQSPEWLIAWARHIARGQVWTLTARADAGSDEALVGIVPLYLWSSSQGRERRLTVLGTGTSDYLDGLFAPGWESVAAHAIFEYLDLTRDRWDACDFQQLREHSPLLESPTPNGWRSQITNGVSCPVLDLPAHVDDLNHYVPRSMLQNLRYYRRRAARAGSIEVSRADTRNLEEGFDTLVRLHAARWSRRDSPGVLADPDVQAMHRECLPDLLGSGDLRLFCLRLDRKSIAVLYGLADPPARTNRRFFYYLGGFDPEYERLSPGTLVIADAIEQAVSEHLTHFDFLRGGEAYKYAWGARDGPTWRRQSSPFT